MTASFVNKPAEVLLHSLSRLGKIQGLDKKGLLGIHGDEDRHRMICWVCLVPGHSHCEQDAFRRGQRCGRQRR
jgi:hypothetical protein